jgi:glyoxylase-like metal-dependent hydrolase (beta-lactamase superfamily II)
MSLAVENYGDVRRVRMASIGSRAFGLDVSAYIVRGVMIDSGFRHARRLFVRAIDSIGISGCIVTHWHEDHAGNAPEIAARGIPILIRSETEEILRRRPKIGAYRHVTWGRTPALRAPATPFDTAGLECVHTPGHTRDHQVVWDPQTRTVFSGDLWLGTAARMMHSSEDPYAIIESLRTVSALQPLRMFDAHRGLIEPAVNALDRKIDWLSGAVATIEDRIKDGCDDATIVKRVLGGETAAALLSQGDYTTRNLVRAVRRRGGSAEC